MRYNYRPFVRYTGIRSKHVNPRVEKNRTADSSLFRSALAPFSLSAPQLISRSRLRVAHIPPPSRSSRLSREVITDVKIKCPALYRCAYIRARSRLRHAQHAREQTRKRARRTCVQMQVHACYPSVAYVYRIVPVIHNVFMY